MWKKQMFDIRIQKKKKKKHDHLGVDFMEYLYFGSIIV